MKRGFYIFATMATIVLTGCGGGGVSEAETPIPKDYLQKNSWYTICKDRDNSYISHFSNDSFIISKYLDKNFTQFDSNKTITIKEYIESGFVSNNNHYFTANSSGYTDETGSAIDSVILDEYEDSEGKYLDGSYVMNRTKEIASKSDNLEDCSETSFE